MPRKKSVKHAAQAFIKEVDSLLDFCKDAKSAGLSDQHLTWAYELALIKLSARFEHLVLHALVGAVNNDTSTIAATTGIPFPKHLTDEVCEYLITQNGYLDFRGRDGLIQKVNEFVPDSHYILTALKKEAYKEALEQLFPLRNFAAHESKQSKRGVLKALGVRRVGSAGAWVKRQRRFDKIAGSVKKLAQEIGDAAPY